MNFKKQKRFMNTCNGATFSIEFKDMNRRLFKTRNGNEEDAFREFMNFIAEKYQYNLMNLLGLRKPNKKVK